VHRADAMRNRELDEATRLERLWAGEFGATYADRNPVVADRRAEFWDGLLARHSIRSALEVGCGQGANLVPIARRLDPADVWGVDVSALAIERARTNAPGINVRLSRARELPFEDDFVDLTFTVGTLIHQPEESLPSVIDEVVRCSRRFVLWGEYHAAATEEVPYRGIRGSLFRRDYAAIYAALHPELAVLESGFLDEDAGFDRVTWQLLEKR
jgi:pseudaminic acid biosynthesis-associated methylase